MKQFVEILQSLSDRTRLRIVRLLADAKTELCVCELVDSLEVPQYNVSRHLAVLRRSGLLSERKEGRWVYYGLSPKPGPFLRHLFAAALSIPGAPFEKDKTELSRRLRIREGGRCPRGIQKARLRPAGKRAGARGSAAR